MAHIIELSARSLPGLPACGLFLTPGEYAAGESYLRHSGSDYPDQCPRQVIRTTLVDENGAFVKAMTEYAEVELDERIVRAVGGDAGVALLRSTARCTTSLYIACCGGFGDSRVLSGKKWTKFLPQPPKGGKPPAKR